MTQLNLERLSLTTKKCVQHLAYLLSLFVFSITIGHFEILFIWNLIWYYQLDYKKISWYSSQSFLRQKQSQDFFVWIIFPELSTKTIVQYRPCQAQDWNLKWVCLLLNKQRNSKFANVDKVPYSSKFGGNLLLRNYLFTRHGCRQ